MYRFLVPGSSAKPLVSAHDRIMGTHTLQGDAPDVAVFAIEIARRLKAACEATSQRAVAEEAGLNSKTVNNIINGISWGSVVAIYQLEEALNTALWSDHDDRSSSDDSEDDESEPKPAPDPRFWKNRQSPNPKTLHHSGSRLG